MSDTIVFFAPGDCAAQGSKRAWVLPGTRRAVLVDASKKTKPWRAVVALCAQQALAGKAWERDGAFEVALTFYFDRPQQHYGKRKGARYLKESAPRLHVSRLDIDKLCRAVLDAGSGVLWRDDRLVAELHAIRLFSDGRAHGPGCMIRVKRVA